MQMASQTEAATSPAALLEPGAPASTCSGEHQEAGNRRVGPGAEQQLAPDGGSDGLRAGPDQVGSRDEFGSQSHSIVLRSVHCPHRIRCRPTRRPRNKGLRLAARDPGAALQVVDGSMAQEPVRCCACCPVPVTTQVSYNDFSAPFLGLAAGGVAEGASKRDYVRWAPEEEEVFYSALRGVAGQKPEVCLREIAARLVGTKDYAQAGCNWVVHQAWVGGTRTHTRSTAGGGHVAAGAQASVGWLCTCTQVRHYYYRLIKRLNRILGEGAALDTRNPLQVHQSMIKFWEVVSPGRYLPSTDAKWRAHGPRLMQLWTYRGWAAPRMQHRCPCSSHWLIAPLHANKSAGCGQGDARDVHGCDHEEASQAAGAQQHRAAQRGSRAEAHKRRRCQCGRVLDQRCHAWCDQQPQAQTSRTQCW